MAKLSLKLILSISIFLGLHFLINCNSQEACGTCGLCGSTSGVQCVNANSYKVCNGDVPIHRSPTLTCQRGTFCGDIKERCAASSKTFTPACPIPQPCRKCHKTREYSCLDATTIAFCSNGHPDLTQRAKCPNGLYCDLSAPWPSFCTADEQATCTPSEYGPGTEKPKTTTIVIPTTTVPLTASEQCIRLGGSPGRFPSFVYQDCSGYLLCLYWNNVIIGQDYPCVGSTAFNRTRQQCVPNTDYFKCF